MLLQALEVDPPWRFWRRTCDLDIRTNTLNCRKITISIIGSHTTQSAKVSGFSTFDFCILNFNTSNAFVARGAIDNAEEVRHVSAGAL